MNRARRRKKEEPRERKGGTKQLCVWQLCFFFLISLLLLLYCTSSFFFYSDHYIHRDLWCQHRDGRRAQFILSRPSAAIGRWNKRSRVKTKREEEEGISLKSLEEIWFESNSLRFLYIFLPLSLSFTVLILAARKESRIRDGRKGAERWTAYSNNDVGRKERKVHWIVNSRMSNPLAIDWKSSSRPLHIIGPA